MKFLAIVFIALSLATCNSTAQSKFTPPAEWQLINECGVRFYIPPEMREEKVKGIDSCVQQYRDANTLVDLDAIMYSDPGGSRRDQYSEERDFNLRKTKVDGQKAEIITYYESELQANARGLNYAAVLYVPQMPKKRGNLTIWTYSRSPEARDIAIKIFESVQFAKE